MLRKIWRPTPCWVPTSTLSRQWRRSVTTSPAAERPFTEQLRNAVHRDPTRPVLPEATELEHLVTTATALREVDTLMAVIFATLPRDGNGEQLSSASAALTVDVMVKLVKATLFCDAELTYLGECSQPLLRRAVVSDGAVTVELLCRLLLLLPARDEGTQSLLIRQAVDVLLRVERCDFHAAHRILMEVIGPRSVDEVTFSLALELCKAHARQFGVALLHDFLALQSERRVLGVKPWRSLLQHACKACETRRQEALKRVERGGNWVCDEPDWTLMLVSVQRAAQIVSNSMESGEEGRNDIMLQGTLAVLSAMALETPGDARAYFHSLDNKTVLHHEIHVELLVYFHRDVSAAVDALRKMVEAMPRKKSDGADAASRALLRGQKVVTRALLHRNDSGDITLAYSLLTAHKYFGLKVDAELCDIVVSAMTTAGDPRVFNVVDVTALFCNSTVGISTVSNIFVVCSMINDVNRAKLLLRLLQKEVPGIEGKLSKQARRALVDLKIIGDSVHLFTAKGCGREVRVEDVAACDQA